MGCSDCFADTLINQDQKAKDVRLVFHKSKDDMLNKFSYCCSNKNYEILKKIYEENDIVSERLNQKIQEYVKIREESKPVEIATGKCGNPCYAYQRKILFDCPKCDGIVNRDIENDYENEVIHNTYSGKTQLQKKYLEKNICYRFNFNEKIDKIDVSVDDFIKYFEKVDENKTVHWSCDTKNSYNYYDRTVIPVEKDMPIHYMLLDGERFDFPYGISMRDFLILNHEKFFRPEAVNPSAYYFFNDQYFRSKKIPVDGEYCNMLYRSEKNQWGQSCGSYNNETLVHIVYIYECDDCHLKYHVIKTSPFHFRDKSKDPK